MFTDYTKGMITEYFVRGAVSHIYRGDRGYPLTIHYRNGRKIVHRSIPCFVVYCRMSFDGKLLYVGNENCVLHCFDSETLDPLDPRLLGMFDNEGAVVNKENFNIFKGLMLTEYEFKAGDYCTQCNSANDVRYSNFDGSILICQKCFNDFYRMMYFRIIDMLADESLAEKRRVKMTSEYTRTECKMEGIHHISAYIKVETSDDVKYYLTHNHPDNYLKSLCYQDKYRDTKITICGLHDDICYEIFIDPENKVKTYIHQPEAISREDREGYKELIKDLSDELLENPFTERLTEYELIQTFSYSTQTPFSNMNVLFKILKDTMDHFGERELLLYTFSDGKIKDCYKYDITKDFKISGYLNDVGGSFLLFSEEKRFAIIHSGYGFAAVGGTYEFMKKFRQFMIKNGIYGTQDFVRYYRLYKKDMNSFYARKRKIVTRATSQKSQAGLYDILHTHIFSSNNRRLIRNDTICHCFYCLKQFEGSKINEWINDRNGKTAVCPFCGIDAILPETCGQKLDEDFLIKMKEYWFESDKLIQINSKLQTYETYYSFILLDTDSLNIILNGIQCYLDGKYILCMNKSDVIQEISGRYTVMNLSFSPFVLNLNINKENNINACDLYLFSQRNEKYKGIISLNNDEYDTIILYFKRIERFMDHKEYLWVCKVSKDMSSILNVAECAFSNRRAPEGNEIIRYIKDHIRDNLTLTKLCEQFHMSRTTLAKIIYDLTGTSPMSYVLEERLTQVLPELVFTDIPVNVLAEKYGFSGDNYFIRCSRKRYGKSPLQYRLERRN